MRENNQPEEILITINYKQEKKEENKTKSMQTMDYMCANQVAFFFK
jgi:hypothetical protein